MESNRSIKRRGVISVLILLLSAGLLYWFAETWLRHLLLYLSTASWARSLVSSLPLAQRVARRFVAGETIDEAVQTTRALNAQGMHVTIDFLGESVSTIGEAEAAAGEILNLLDSIALEELDATVSVKLSQLGLKINPEKTYEIMRGLAARAAERKNKVRIDMEESDVVDITLDIFHRLRFGEAFENVGIVVQSYLYRTEKDVAELIEQGASVRLCKGAYMEPASVAYPSKDDTDRSFVRLAEMMLSETARRNGLYLGVATHDEKMIEATKRFARQKGIDAGQYEFQMLYGIRRDLQESLIAEGYQVRIYVPYGTAWYPYFVRRLAERPANLWFFLSNLIRQ